MITTYSEREYNDHDYDEDNEGVWEVFDTAPAPDDTECARRAALYQKGQQMIAEINARRAAEVAATAEVDTAAQSDAQISERIAALVLIGDELAYVSAYTLVQDVLPLPEGWRVWRDALRLMRDTQWVAFAVFYARRINERWPKREESAVSLLRNWALVAEVMPWE